MLESPQGETQQTKKAPRKPLGDVELYLRRQERGMRAFDRGERLDVEDPDVARLLDAIAGRTSRISE